MGHEPRDTLSPWNLLDHGRLLTWLFLEPSRLAAYRAQAGDDAVRRVGAWTASTLIWLPFLIVALAVLLGTVPVGDDVSSDLLSSPLAFTLGGGLWFGPIALGWALTGWLGKADIVRRRGRRHLVMLFAALAFVAGACWVCGLANQVVRFASELNLVSLGAVSASLFLALFIARGVAFGLAGCEAAYVADALTGGLLLLVLTGLVLSILRFGQGQNMPEGLGFTAVRDANPAVILATTAFLLLLGILARSVLEQPTQTGWRARLRPAFLAGLVLSHVALVWLCLLAALGLTATGSQRRWQDL